MGRGHGGSGGRGAQTCAVAPSTTTSAALASAQRSQCSPRLLWPRGRATSVSECPKSTWARTRPEGAHAAQPVASRTHITAHTSPHTRASTYRDPLLQAPCCRPSAAGLLLQSPPCCRAPLLQPACERPHSPEQSSRAVPPCRCRGGSVAPQPPRRSRRRPAGAAAARGSRGSTCAPARVAGHRVRARPPRGAGARGAGSVLPAPPPMPSRSSAHSPAAASCYRPPAAACDRPAPRRRPPR